MKLYTTSWKTVIDLEHIGAVTPVNKWYSFTIYWVIGGSITIDWHDLYEISLWREEYFLKRAESPEECMNTLRDELVKAWESKC